MVSSPSAKKRRKNYYSGEIDKSITNIQTRKISQAKSVHKYGIPRQTLEYKCKNKTENVLENMPDSLPVLVDTEERNLVQWSLTMHKQSLPVGLEMITQKASEIHRYIFGYMRSVGFFRRVWCDRFMSWHGELTLRTAQVIRQERKEAISERLRNFFREICQRIIKRTLKKEQLWNMYETGFINKKNSRKVVVLKRSRNVWSKCADENFTWQFSYVFPLINLLRRHCWFSLESGWIRMLSKVEILRMITLQQQQNVFSIILYS